MWFRRARRLNMVACGLAVTGIDASPSLVTLCREHMPGHQWIVGDMRFPPLSQRFDGILAWDSFFHLRPDDQRRMFRVFAKHIGRRAVLRPPGRTDVQRGTGARRGGGELRATRSITPVWTLRTTRGCSMGSASISSPRLSKTAEPEAGRSGLRGRAPEYSN